MSWPREARADNRGRLEELPAPPPIVTVHELRGTVLPGGMHDASSLTAA